VHPQDPPPRQDEDHDRPSRAAILISLGGVAAIVALVLLVEPLRSALGDALNGDTAALRKDLRGLGFGGVLLVFGLAIAHAVVWYPTEILNLAAGYIYGFWGAFAIHVVGWLVSGLICFYIGRHAARPALASFLGEHRFMRYERAVERGGVTLLLAMRLIPVVPYSLFSYAAGSARVPVWRFAWTSVVGYLPITVIVIYLGSRLEELSPTDPLLWIGAAVIIAMLLFTRRMLPRFTDEENV
jgi:uncharacterized membrane protein YdjX (TVP38/TMEM64 family)